MDDIILTGNDEVEIGQLKTLLPKEFEDKGLRSFKVFSWNGVELARLSRGISVSQRKYTLDMLQELGMLRCKIGDIPIEPNRKLGLLKKSETVDRERYQRLIGVYLSHMRSDIAFAMSVVS